MDIMEETWNVIIFYIPSSINFTSFFLLILSTDDINFSISVIVSESVIVWRELLPDIQSISNSKTAEHWDGT